MKALILSNRGLIPSRASLAAWAAFLLALALLLGLGGSQAFAMPPNPLDPPDLGDNPGDFTPPDNGFSWRMAPRFGVMNNGIVDYHWDTGKARYYSDWVHPTHFTVNLYGCRSLDDDTGGLTNTYTWTFDEDAPIAGPCYIDHVFEGQGNHTATLTVTDGDGEVILDSEGRGNPFTQTLELKDFLIVSLGDSLGSGEGAPDVPQLLFNPDAFGQPTASIDARWQDVRCHRSANAAAAQAAQAIENADPHTSVTFLSFACSGSTIDVIQYDESMFSPYRNPFQYGWTKNQGSGVLGPSSGAVPPNPDRPQDNQLPSQIAQLETALTGSDGTKRPVDALIVSGGANDMGFAKIATLCVLYGDCENYTVQDEGNHETPLYQRVQQDTARLADRYSLLADTISNTVTFNPNGKVYITEYPDYTKNSSGGYCDEMLQDVTPTWTYQVLQPWALVDLSLPPAPPFKVDRDEVAWAGGTVIPGLNTAIRAAVDAAAQQGHRWVLVDGIADESGNIFSGHGYCAADNWVNTATEAMDNQGPWAPWYVPLNTNTSKTRGTLHPNARGYAEIGKKIEDKLAANLLVMPPANLPPPPTFVSTSDESVTGASGWLTGHSADTSCPAGASECVLLQEGTTVSGSTIRGASVRLNGAPLACSTAGSTTNGVTCQGQLADPANTYNWSLAFANDGVYSLKFAATAWNGTQSQSTRQVKVDLHNPTVNTALSESAPASGWYRVPMTVTLTGMDGTGSGVQYIQYQLDGTNNTGNGSSYAVGLDTDGVHTLSYHVTDGAGQSSADQQLTVKVDQTAPEPTITASTDPNAAGWYKADVSVTLGATDDTSGVDSYTYRLEGAQALDDTEVGGSTPTELTIDKEGTTTITVTAIDVAGNTKAKQLVINFDKTAPTIAIAAPGSAGYLLNQAVSASYGCTDSTSGVDKCDGTAANGASADTSSIGTKSFVVSATDKAGNTASQTVSYPVTYGVALLFEQNRSYKLGSTVPIKLQLGEAQGANVSASTLVLTAGQLVKQDDVASTTYAEDAGNANPDNAFRYDPTLGGYIYNLSTKGLTQGTWKLTFTVAGDPVPHSLTFDVR